MPLLGFGQVVIDAHRADELAAFYSRLLERPVGDASSPYFAVIPPSTDGPALMFLAVPESRSGKNRIHLDFTVSEPEQAVAHALEAGATQVGQFAEFGTRWITFADPEGNLFDIGLPHQD